MSVKRKNFSFYMPEDFADKLDKVQDRSENIKNLSKSQALYFLVSNMAQDGADAESANQSSESE